MSDPFLEAVKAVPHRDFRDGGGECSSLDDEHPRPCDCDRDERIAKGLKAAVAEGRCGADPHGDLCPGCEADALAAFTEASGVTGETA